MITPILIEKKPGRHEHLSWGHNDFEGMVSSIDLDDLLIYILEQINKPPTVYWHVSDINDEIFYGDLLCTICFYLKERGLLIIEDTYYNEVSSNRTKYIGKGTYFNPLENQLYNPILDRLSGWHLDELEDSYYKVGRGYLRVDKLENILKVQ